ncbi:MAG: hypothetical protein MOIL_01816 [Candidatus Methanolliviera sp. GoM_oil]|nr:MAG: hypothetical protein MOIL_01816 [Candidatus Methanolliviera sp. GoM_oil]
MESYNLLFCSYSVIVSHVFNVVGVLKNLRFLAYRKSSICNTYNCERYKNVANPG